MLDLTSAPRRATWEMPARVKLFFLCLPWALVVYGGFVLVEHVAFYNNSVPTEATVVDLDPAREPVYPGIARVIGTLNKDGVSPWFEPRYLYAHENGAAYVGAALALGLTPAHAPGDTVTIRYDRGRPDLAQPVSFLTFWIEPAKYIGAGLFLFFVLAYAFRIVDSAPSGPAPDYRPHPGRAASPFAPRLKYSS